MSRFLFAGLWFLAVVIVLAAPAHADIGGTPSGPGPCDYPFTGVTGMVNPILGRAEWAYCRGPQEINGSYYVQALGDYVIGGGIIGPHGGSAVLGVGGGGTRTGFFCLAEPDNGLAFIDPNRTQKSADPNPPGAWKSEIHPKLCVPDAAPPPPPSPAPEYQPPASNLDPALPQPVNVDPPR